MADKNNFLSLFSETKPIIAMLHLKGSDHKSIFNRFKKELKMFVENGIDGVIIEDYFGTYKDMEKALAYIESKELPIPYGVNCLNVDQMGFSLAKKYGASFVQLDSVVGHVKPRDEDSIEAFLAEKREEYSGFILGGVRFKYQPVLSENSEDEDLKVAKKRCDAICVTGDATGSETPMKKVERFRESIGNFPLFIGAGVTPETLCNQFKFADGAIIGSYFKQDYKAENEVSEENIKKMLNKVKQIRKECLYD
jgi:predicted TIM-barrel enzyme